MISNYLPTESNLPKESKKKLNVHVQMILSMAKVLNSQSLLSLSLDLHNKVIKLFVKYLNKMMTDYRERGNRSYIM